MAISRTHFEPRRIQLEIFWLPVTLSGPRQTGLGRLDPQHLLHLFVYSARSVLKKDSCMDGPRVRRVQCAQVRER
jgi:hypothetical protein